MMNILVLCLSFLWLAIVWSLKLVGLMVVPACVGALVGFILGTVRLHVIGYVAVAYWFFQQLQVAQGAWMMGFCIVGLVGCVGCCVQSIRSACVKAVRISKSHRSSVTLCYSMLIPGAFLVTLPSYESIWLLGNVKWQAYLIMGLFPLSAIYGTSKELMRYEKIKACFQHKGFISDQDLYNIAYEKDSSKEDIQKSYEEIRELFACMEKTEDISTFEGKQITYYFQTPQLPLIRNRLLSLVPTTDAITVSEWKACPYGKALQDDFVLFVRDLLPEVQWGNRDNCEVVTQATQGDMGLCHVCG